MMRSLCALIACCLTLSSTPVLAQSINVRTGEHGAFTRVVLNFDARPEWAAGRTQDGYALRFGSPLAAPPDLSRAFDLITRDRVADLRVDVALGVFNIDLGCACWAEFSEFGPNALIVDIRPGDAPPDAPFEARLQWPSDTAPIVSADVPSLADPDVQGPPESLPQPQPRAIRRPVIAALPTIRADTAFSPELTRETETTVTADASTTVDTLATEVARAIAQGLLQQDEAPTETRAEPAVGDQLRNLSVDTAIDAALGLGNSENRALDATGTCIPVNRINVIDWAPPDGIGGLGDLRRAAIAEDGSLTQDGIRTLARAYINLGFGAEARALAKSLSPGLDQDVLLALAEIADHGRSDAPILDAQFACSPEASVWRALARPFSADDLPKDIAPILAKFSSLPVTLRVHLGPVMAERLRQAGLPAESRIALNTVARGGNVSIEQMLTVARLDLTSTRAEDARTRLETLAAGTGLTAAEALVELLRDSERREVPPQIAWVDDAPSLVRATRGTDVARDLSLAALRGGLALDRFDEVRRTLADGPAELTSDDLRALLLELAQTVVDRGPDDAFLKTTVLLRDRMDLTEYPRDLRIDMVSRFASLGLPDRALDYVPSPLVSDEERILVAGTHAAMGAFDVGLSLLDGVTADAANLQRARLLSLSGRPAEAAVEYQAANEAMASVREAIRAADWGKVQRLTEVDGDAKTQLEPSASDALPPSGSNIALLSRIADRRASLGELLALTEIE